MIEHGVDPKSIILFTFTNKAAKELQIRIRDFIGERSMHMTVGTYHSVCARLLRVYADRIGYTSKFSIFDIDDSMNIIKKLAKKYRLDKDYIKNFIADCKKKNLSVSKVLTQAESEKQQVAMCYRDYQTELRNQDAMDFDDLIINMVLLLTTCPDVKEKLNQKYKYIVAK
jgi:DNA helicase II / ATP-dependent DNA helicase PcrA